VASRTPGYRKLGKGRNGHIYWRNRLRREGFVDLEANVANKGWTFADATHATSLATFVQLRDTDLDGDVKSIHDTDKYRAVRFLEDAAYGLPVNYKHRRFIIEWVESGGETTQTGRLYKLSRQRARTLVKLFLEKTGVANPWLKQAREPDLELCLSPDCTTTYAHSPHGHARQLTKSERRRLELQLVPPKKLP
jgi:hypothetical protein